MPTPKPPFGVRLTPPASPMPLSCRCFKINAFWRFITQSLLVLLLLLTSSAAGAVDSLEPLVQSSTTAQHANLFEFDCFADKNPFSSPNDRSHQTLIGLQISNDSIHQLITRIFGIFLREVLHYPNVMLVPIQFPENIKRSRHEDEKFTHILDNLHQHPDFSKTPMINLAVWASPVGHALIPEEVLEAGASMTPGRFGWFVPTDFIQNFNRNETIDSLDYRIFQNPKHPAYNSFIIDEGMLQTLRKNTNSELFLSPNCVHRQCVTLLAGYRESTSFVEYQIMETGSYVNILWLGKDLKEKVSQLYKSYHENETLYGYRFIVLHWTPSDVIDDEISFSQIAMPRCELYSSLQEASCKYELTPILKYFSEHPEIESNSRLFYALRHMHLKMIHLMELQSELNDERKRSNVFDDEIFNSVACNWMKNNVNVLNMWNSPEPTIRLLIGGIFPISETSRGHRNLVHAVERAEKAINEKPKFLTGYNFTIHVHDGKCRADTVMKSFIHYYNVPNVLGVLGPACSETVEPIAGISKHMNMAVISYSAEGASFINRRMYPYFFRTIGSNRQYEDVYIKLMQSFSWHRVAALTEDGQKYTDYISHMEANMTQHNLDLIVNKKFLSDVTAAEMNTSLMDLKKRHAKIIIADIHNRNAELALCEAYKLGMTAYEGYVWFLPSWLSKDWKMLSQRSNNSCTPEQMQEAYEGHFTLKHTPFGNLNSKMQENITIKKWLERYEADNETISDYIGFAYDAVWAYAIAANELLRENHDAISNLRSSSVVERFTQLIWQTDFEGLSGHVRFGEGGSRISEIDILQWQSSYFKPVGKFYPEVEKVGKDLKLNGGELKLAAEEIKWMSGNEPPGDGTYDCSLSALASFINVDCDTAAVILTALLCLLAVFVISLISFLFWKHRYDSKLRMSAKFMKSLGIDLSSSGHKMNTLDKWEIPKDNVIVNRRLGEGAFGTVYGGEARLASEGWTAVAVKTLKAGASTEDRIDYLAEAETMKRLDHNNIVKLLAVCRKSEPIFTIMEFMLYGDLKTYLLARRHMVNDKITDESDISPKRLTMYAMDVARGLAYLAQQKYVHRDLACRNCLVNAQRVVKLGDFGLARPTYESDYYRFNRKGMMPVRWMAPEALALGMFTTASDIWAFGVVVFEIITFGSFPFQGLTNNQVLEYVKSGKTLKVPVDAKPQLESLINSCWSQEVKRRPTAVEIIDYISNHPRLLTPCLDYPGASVEMPENENDDFDLLPKIRRCSPNNRDSTLDILPPSSSISNFDHLRSLDQSESTPIDIPNEYTRTSATPKIIETFSPTTPDGYSIMSPLLMHQMSENSDSSQTRLIQRCSTETLQMQSLPFK